MVADNLGHPTVRAWFDEALAAPSLDAFDCVTNMGHVRHAFTLSMYFLRRGTPYERAIFETLKKGGDTDTNAKIVGSLLGALHGPAGIPRYMWEPVMSYDPREVDAKSLLGSVRPGQYRPHDAFTSWHA